MSRLRALGRMPVFVREFSSSIFGRRLLIRMLAFAACLSLLAGAIQLFVDYQRDVRRIEQVLVGVGQRFIADLMGLRTQDAAGRLTLDGLGADRALAAMVSLPDVDYAELHVDGVRLASAGQVVGESALRQHFSLPAVVGGASVAAELRLATDLARVRQRAMLRAGDVLVSIVLMTLAFVAFLYLLVGSMVTRHLVRISAYVSEASFSNLDLPLYLKRPPSRLGKEDELDQLVNAFNRMRHTLLQSYEELHGLNADLERRVAERTEALRRQVEESIRHQWALETSEAQLRAIVDSALEGIVVTNGRGLVTVFNPAAERLFGYSAAEMRGSRISRLMPEVDGRTDGGGAVTGGEAADAAEFRVVGQSREVMARRQDGSVFPVQLAVSEARVGVDRLMICIIHDVSERKQIENALVRAKVAAEDASRAKSEFLSRMSHELRTPLNAIIGFGQLVMTDPLDPATPGQRENVEQIIKAGQHLLELINEVLDLARIEAGRHELELAPVEVMSLFDELLTLLQPLADQAAVRVLPVAAEEPEIWVLADRTRLKQCLLNLLSNAIKYNRVDGQVRAFIDREGDEVMLAVADTGQGFSVAQKARLFEPFQRLGAEDSEIQGTGIGLAITRRLLETMGGRIDAEARPGVGATFMIHLPVAQAPEVGADVTAPPALAVPAVAAGHAEPVRMRHVLYIEDNPANIALMRKMLQRRADVQLEVAESGPAGLARLTVARPDILLLDINLPGMNGFQILQQLRQLPDMQVLPVVAVSANAMPEDIRHAREAGFTDYLVKPFDMGELFRLIDERVPPGGRG